jgi:hypothetical protein
MWLSGIAQAAKPEKADQCFHLYSTGWLPTRRSHFMQTDRHSGCGEQSTKQAPRNTCWHRKEMQHVWRLHSRGVRQSSTWLVNDLDQHVAHQECA